MPCWTIKKTVVDVGKMNVEILTAGLKAAGFFIGSTQQGMLTFAGQIGEHKYEIATGKLLIDPRQNAEALTAEVKRAYSAQVVRQTANRFGWKLSSKPNTNQFVAQRRR